MIPARSAFRRVHPDDRDDSLQPAPTRALFHNLPYTTAAPQIDLIHRATQIAARQNSSVAQLPRLTSDSRILRSHVVKLYREAPTEIDCPRCRPDQRRATFVRDTPNQNAFGAARASARDKS